ncbi:MAG: tRNA lysidine(34) synthetase TilS [Oscillospiraceae bacterium]
MRYAFLTDCAAAHGYDWIATAHTADDNAETLLLNLARGCGLRGLTGIPPQRGKLLRPMLDTTRAEAEAYLAAHGIAHVEDSTNASDAYARNRIRHHAVPALESVNAAFVQHAADTAALLREDEWFLGGLAAEFLAGQTPAEGIPTAELAGAAAPSARARAAAGGRTRASRRHLLALEQLCGGEGLG